MGGWKYTANKKVSEDDDDIICSSHNIDADDLIMEILLRLPPISVHRFRRVCKQWYSLISNPDFLRTHAITTDHDPLLVSISKLRPFKGHVDFVHVPYNNNRYDEDEDDEKNHGHRRKPGFLLFELFPTNILRNYQLIDSSNGLLLFCDNNTIYDHQNLNSRSSSTNYYVTNPITKYYFKLPTMIPIPNIKPEEKPKLENLNSPRHTTLVFDPSISLSYKVIRYFIRGSRPREHDSDMHLQIYVYSSETRSWRVLSARIPDPMGSRFGMRSVVLDGVLYWSYWITRGDVSVCFDVDKECVWVLPLPPKPNAYNRIRNCLYFGESGGRLRLIEKFLDSPHDHGNNCLPCSFDVMEIEPQQQQQQQIDPYYTWTVKSC